MPALDFDATKEQGSMFTPLPPGEYKVVITESEEKQTKLGDGSYLQFTFVVLDGDHKNRKIWTRLNLNNKNDQAVGMARAELKAICEAVNVPQIKDTAQLHDLPLIVRVVTKKDKDGEERSEIKGYKPAVPSAAAKAPAANGGAKGPPPWTRGQQK